MARNFKGGQEMESFDECVEYLAKPTPGFFVVKADMSRMHDG